MRYYMVDNNWEFETNEVAGSCAGCSKRAYKRRGTPSILKDGVWTDFSYTIRPGETRFNLIKFT
jgi:hypothetical protein